MALTRVQHGTLSDNSVSSLKLQNQSVTSSKINDTGLIVRSQSYSSGHGVGARTISNASSWYTILINGTNSDTQKPSDNQDIRWFDKQRAGTHLRIRGSFPMYMASGAGGVGLRIQMVLSALPSLYNNAASYFTVGPLTNGMAERWGASGYGGASANIINVYYDTAFGNASVLNHTGRLHFYFQGYTWNTGDTAYWLDYDNTPYAKYGNWSVEEYVV